MERIARRAEPHLGREGYPAEEEGEAPDGDDGLALAIVASLLGNTGPP